MRGAEHRFNTNSDSSKAQAIAVIRELGPGHLIEVGPQETKRSIAQNALIHALFRKIADHTGADFEGVKLAMKMKFLGIEVYEFMGEVFAEPQETKRLSVKRMDRFIEQVMAWCVMNGIEVDFRELDRTREIGK